MQYIIIMTISVINIIAYTVMIGLLTACTVVMVHWLAHLLYYTGYVFVYKCKITNYIECYGLSVYDTCPDTLRMPVNDRYENITALETNNFILAHNTGPKLRCETKLRYPWVS